VKGDQMPDKWSDVPEKKGDEHWYPFKKITPGAVLLLPFLAFEIILLAIILCILVVGKS
jgi:hypothetical protein